MAERKAAKKAAKPKEAKAEPAAAGPGEAKADTLHSASSASNATETKGLRHITEFKELGYVVSLQTHKHVVGEAHRQPVVKGEAKATILSYRGSRKTRRMNQMLVEVEGADSKTKASAYIGRRIVWKTPSGRLIYGRITHAHGNKGVLRVRFPKGLPGEALGKKAKVV